MKQLAVVVATILSKPEAVRVLVLELLLPCWYQEINIRSYRYPLQQANEEVVVVVLENGVNVGMMTRPPRSIFWTRQDCYHRDLVDAPRQRL